LKSPLLAYKFTILAAAAILAALLIPSSSLPKMESPLGFDKVIHFILFFILALTYSLEYRKDRGNRPGFLHGILAISAFIVISEVLQLFTSSRHFEVLDIISGSLGAVGGFLLTLAFPKPGPGQKERDAR